VKILLLHSDIVPWASWVRALELKKQWVNDEVDIIRADFDDKNFINCDTYKYDVVHCLYSGGMSKILYLVAMCKGKFYGTIASERTLDGVYDNVKILIDAYKHCNKIVAQNLGLKNRLASMLGTDKNIVYIPNGVDEESFKKDIKVGYVGSGNEYNHQHKGMYLVKQACEELGVEMVRTNNSYPDNVIPHDKMPDFYRNLSCLVIPSKSEGCNNPTLEALAMNIPVVTTRVGIAEELHGAILVDRTVEDIKRGIKQAIPRFEILEKYTWKTVAQQYRNLYELESQRT